ncbi:MAG: glycosyltransferase family 39 protein [Acidobacteriota bacterium]
MIESRTVAPSVFSPRFRWRSIGIPLLLAAFYASTALLWFVVTPPFEAPDENAHYDFIAFLATERRLPDADPATRAGWNFQEWMQPPLYYALIAPVAALTGPDRNVFSLAPVNPNRPQEGGNSPRTFTWDGRRSPGIDTVFYARFASLLMGGLGVLLIYWAAGRVLPRDQAGLMAAAVVFIPQYTYLAAALTNDTLASLLSTATIGLLLTTWQRRALPLTLAGAIGLCAGAAVVAKIHTVFLFPTIAIAVAFHARGQLLRALTFLVVAAAGSFASASWYFLRNLIVFGDPMASRFKVELLGSVVRPSQLSLLDPYLYTSFPSGLFRTFWASFGWVTIEPPDGTMIGYAALSGLLLGATLAYFTALPRRGMVGRPGKILAILLAAASAGVGVAATWAANSGARALVHGFAAAAGVCIAASLVYLVVLTPVRPVERAEREIVVTLAAGIAILFLELVLYNLTWPNTNQGRYLYPALAPIAIVAALAVKHAAARVSPPLRCWALPVLVVFLSVAWTISFHSGVAGFHFW